MSTEPKKIFLLNTLVGSWAHGLNEPDSDKDFRGVYVIPTKDLLSLGFDGIMEAAGWKKIYDKE